jgi:hypothetical protein
MNGMLDEVRDLESDLPRHCKAAVTAIRRLRELGFMLTRPGREPDGIRVKYLQSRSAEDFVALIAFGRASLLCWGTSVSAECGRNAGQAVFPISNKHHNSHLRRVRSLRRGPEGVGPARAAVPGAGVFARFMGVAHGDPRQC